MSSLDTFAQNLPICVAVYNLQTGQYRFLSEQIKNLIGVESKEILKKGVSFVHSLTHPEDLEKLIEDNNRHTQYIKEHPQEVKTYWADFTYRLKNTNGEWIKVNTRGRALNLDEDYNVKEILNFTFLDEDSNKLDLQELGSAALMKYDEFSSGLVRDLSNHVHVLEFIISELVEDTISIDRESLASVKKKLQWKSLALSEVSTKLTELAKGLR